MLIANTDGWRQYCCTRSAAALGRALGALDCHAADESPADGLWTALPGAPLFKCPKKLHDMLQQAPQPASASAPERGGPLSAHASPDTVLAMAEAICAGTVPPLRWDAASILYVH